jgi:hypothetical protein
MNIDPGVRRPHECNVTRRQPASPCNHCRTKRLQRVIERRLGDIDGEIEVAVDPPTYGVTWLRRSRSQQTGSKSGSQTPQLTSHDPDRAQNTGCGSGREGRPAVPVRTLGRDLRSRR